MADPSFEWDAIKDIANHTKHGVTFVTAQRAFTDPFRVITKDVGHSGQEERYFCLGKVEGNVLTVRFTWRMGRIRIIGAGYWRKGKAIYEAQED